MSGPTLHPDDVSNAVQVSLNQRSVLPLTFIETSAFEQLSHLLTRYMNPVDVVVMMAELRKNMFSGFTSMNAQELHNLIQHCRKCSGIEHPPIVPKWNCVDPDLMIIAENPTSVIPYATLLSAPLKDAGFSSDRCMLTYITRCNTKKPSTEIITNCLPYIHTEIATVNPKLIMTLGLGAYRSLSGDDSSKLNEVRGSIRWLGPYPVLPEVSLAWIAHQREESQTIRSPLEASLESAFSFLYTKGSNAQ